MICLQVPSWHRRLPSFERVLMTKRLQTLRVASVTCSRPTSHHVACVNCLKKVSESECSNEGHAVSGAQESTGDAHPRADTVRAGAIDGVQRGQRARHNGGDGRVCTVRRLRLVTPQGWEAVCLLTLRDLPQRPVHKSPTRRTQYVTSA